MVGKIKIDCDRPILEKFSLVLLQTKVVGFPVYGQELHNPFVFISSPSNEGGGVDLKAASLGEKFSLVLLQTKVVGSPELSLPRLWLGMVFISSPSNEGGGQFYQASRIQILVQEFSLVLLQTKVVGVAVDITGVIIPEVFISSPSNEGGGERSSC